MLTNATPQMIKNYDVFTHNEHMWIKVMNEDSTPLLRKATGLYLNGI